MLKQSLNQKMETPLENEHPPNPGNTMKAIKLTLLLSLPLTLQVLDTNASDQYANSVIDFSSEYSTGPWSSMQTLGPPDTFAYGDIHTAWAPRSQNGTTEFLTVGFSSPVFANGVTIRETFGNGFVYQVDVRDTSGVFHTAWNGVDPSLPGAPVDFLVTFPQTPFLVDAVRIHVDTDHDLFAWEEVDAITLHGGNDRDGDGIPDALDACPDSIMNATVVINECDSGVENILFDDGCTLADLVQMAADEARNHGAFVSNVARMANTMKRKRILNARDAASLKRCAAQSSVQK